MLIDRLARDEPGPPNGHIAAHSFSAALWFRSKAEVTDAQIINAFNLSADDQTGYNQIITFWGTLNAADKAQFHSRLEAGLILLQDGYISRAKFKSLLGMT